MIQTTVADVIRPAVTADNPDAFFDQHIRQAREVFAFIVRQVLEFLFEFFNPNTLGINPRLIVLIRLEQTFCQFLAKSV